MKASDYLVDKLISAGVTDAYGIPGGVVLELLYALDRRPKITPHLCYHEQGAGFAACGQAQATGSLSLAYATRGPGFTNLITTMAEAYYESLPVLFITAHSAKDYFVKARAVADQEMDTVAMVSDICKFAARVDTTEDFAKAVNYAIKTAISGRSGAVFLDINASLWQKEIEDSPFYQDENLSETDADDTDYTAISDSIYAAIAASARPLILFGDGIRQANCEHELVQWLDKVSIPSISSRGAQGIAKGTDTYYGYIGSHGVRYANAILEKSDLLIVIGNRMSFPIDSTSYSQTMKNKKIIWVDIDDGELERELYDSKKYKADARQLLIYMNNCQCTTKFSPWLDDCKKIKSLLKDMDVHQSTHLLEHLLTGISPSTTVVADVGNNEFILSRAYEHSGICNQILYSKGFGSLGLSIPKSIGVSLSKRPVMCVTGDQGFQLNMQELNTIAKEQLPVCIVIINNRTSAMIRDRQEKFGYYMHTTAESGYHSADIARISAAYGIAYKKIESSDQDLAWDEKTPVIVELETDPLEKLEPSLPKGAPLTHMAPALEETLRKQIDSI